jgi:hypothetical protein
MRLFFGDGIWGATSSSQTEKSGAKLAAGRKFAVLGGGHEAGHILDLLCALGLDVVAHHEMPRDVVAPPQSIRQRYGLTRSGLRYVLRALSGRGEPRARTIPKVESAKFAKLINSGRAELIVASYLVDAQTDQFLAACDYASRELRFRGRMLHLSSLCDIFEFPSGPRYLLTGIASSGNIIFQNLLDAILAQDTSKPLLRRDAVSGEIARFALYHLESIRKLFSETIGDVSTAQVLASGTHVNYGQCLVQKEDQYCAVSGLPLRSYAWGERWSSSHEPIERPTVDFFKRQGYEIIYILRHPLDVIVSNAAKISSVLPGRKRPRLALDNLQWFTGILDTVCRHYEGLCAHKSALQFVRYEALIVDPVEEIGRLAGFVNVDMAPDMRRALWERLNGVPVAGEKHFWDPRAGKWKEHLGAAHRDIVLASKLPQLARAFGYEIDPVGFARATDPEQDHESFDETAMSRLAWIDAILEIPIGKPLTLSGDLVRNENEDLGLTGFFDGMHERQGRALLNSPALRTLVESAFWNGAGPVPSTVRAYLGL